jgi:hypothetical protein
MRRWLVLVLLAAVALLGWLLFANVQQSRLFRLTAPQPTLSQTVQSKVSRTAVVSLTTVSASTLLVNPRYTGQDSLGRNWQLTAQSASQQGSAASGTYVLQQVQGRWDDPSQTKPLTLSAAQADYLPAAGTQSGTLVLRGNVQVTGGGLNLAAPTLTANLDSREVSASGGSKVTGQVGNWGMAITAPNLQGSQNNQQLRFTGGVHAILTPMKGAQ